MSERKDLWNSLSLAAPEGILPWAIIGDFNCCRYANEKLGGSSLSQPALKDFNDFIFLNGLEDLNSVGGKFTWYNQQIDNPIHIKLDRVLVNDIWRNSYPDSFCSIQRPSCSDHCPIILHPGKAMQALHRFLFKNYWTKIDSYWSILLEVFTRPCSGNPLSHLCISLRMLKSAIKKEYWASSNSVSRHIDYLLKKQSYLLEQMQHDHRNAELNMAYKYCNTELVNFNRLHASWIIQRAKINWLKYGEDDLKFLYAKIKSRMGGKKSVLNLLSCSSTSNRAEIVSTIIQYFQALYNPHSSHNMAADAIPTGVIVPDCYHATLSSPVLDEEIKAAVFMGSSNSSPGPDGYNFYFYMSSWHIIGPVTNCLCNVVYKIIAKVIAVRLKPVMNIIVKDNQAGFLKSRVSTDNILLASDILYHSGKKGKGKFFCAKLDIKKAFDSVSREFLITRLIQKDFPSRFVSWVKACICDVNFSVLLSGALEGYFPSAAGLRQGCPISPYLFCLAMDAFSNLLEDRGFKGICSNEFSISHLLYADDVLIFGEATLENCNLLVSILNDFARASGLHVNYDKTAIMFPKNLNNQHAICQALSIHNIATKITYLGIPLSFHRLKIEDYLPLIDSLNKKFSGWKANLLSFAGRLQYLKFTIQNTIAYWIRGAILPKYVHKFLKKTSSKFLFFGDVNSNKKLHMIAWNKVCLPFSKGGLGISFIPAMLFSYNCSVISRMYNCTSPLSVWLLNKYRSPWKASLADASKMWKSICLTANMAKHCFKFKITKAAPISLKWDHWYQNCTLSEFFGSVTLPQIPDIQLCNIMSNSGWTLPDSLTSGLRDVLRSIYIFDEDGPCLLWYDKEKVNYNNFMKEFYSDISDCSWYKMIWHKRKALKFSVYAWLAIMGGLKTAEALRIRNVFVPSTCCLCHTHDETVYHLYFECSYSFSILTSIIPGMDIFLFRPNILQVYDWLNGKYNDNTEMLNFYKLAVSSVIYYIWKERNNRIFGNKLQCHTSLQLCIKRALSERIMTWGYAIDFLDGIYAFLDNDEAPHSSSDGLKTSLGNQGCDRSAYSYLSIPESR
ncbi:uncharacterized protein LOC114579456 [Dendrobium catenatum]|uniref:uncharacterized protein LOC114579456 n=1 Tax=Dendrobium catenatum TaxID=906689 RepID=UPI00109F63CD|nr:uncharacterized protein LOC114579456 [Dendrobium catenatum]